MEKTKDQKVYIMSSKNPIVIQSPITSYIVHYNRIFASPSNFIRRTIDYRKMKVYDEKYRKESERLLSLQSLSIINVNLIFVIAKSGFFHDKNLLRPDQVRCIYCQGVISDWKWNDIPNKRHKFSYPTCPFILDLNVGNEPLESEPCGNPNQDPNVTEPFTFVNFITVSHHSEALDEVTEKIEKLGFDSREKSFANFPHLEHFAFQGLYVFTKDGVSLMRCTSCEKIVPILDNAENLDNCVWHTENCKFRRIDSMAESSSQRINYCKVEYSFTEQELNDRLDSRLVSQLPDIDPEDLRVLYQNQLTKKGKGFESLFELLLALKNMKKVNRQKSSVEENNLFYLDFVCVVCIENPVEMIFLPCGHLKTCSVCGYLVKNCPICRESIQKRVRNFKFNASEN